MTESAVCRGGEIRCFTGDEKVTKLTKSVDENVKKILFKFNFKIKLGEVSSCKTDLTKMIKVNQLFNLTFYIIKVVQLLKKWVLTLLVVVGHWSRSADTVSIIFYHEAGFNKATITYYPPYHFQDYNTGNSAWSHFCPVINIFRSKGMVLENDLHTRTPGVLVMSLQHQPLNHGFSPSIKLIVFCATFDIFLNKENINIKFTFKFVFLSNSRFSYAGFTAATLRSGAK